jgi:6-phosphogluconate dehydrogenase (decarboxylating)
MIGGDKEKYSELMSVWEAVSAPDSFAYFGGIGAGHFAKMVHNGIEYGMMQAIAEERPFCRQVIMDLIWQKYLTSTTTIV